MKNKKIIITVAIAAVIAALAIFAMTRDNDTTESTPQNQIEEAIPTGEEEPTPQPTTTPTPEPTAKPAENTADNTEAKTFTPTFMYFVSSNEGSYDEAMKTVEALKRKYGEKITFDIKDVGKNPEILGNFAFVEGNTPALIMLNTKNDISNILMKATDMPQLEQAIEEAIK